MEWLESLLSILDKLSGYHSESFLCPSPAVPETLSILEYSRIIDIDITLVEFCSINYSTLLKIYCDNGVRSSAS